MKTHSMRLISGVPGITQKVIWSYRGFTLTQSTRRYDVRNKTNKGNDWTISIAGSPDRFTHNRNAARALVDALIATPTHNP